MFGYSRVTSFLQYHNFDHYAAILGQCIIIIFGSTMLYLVITYYQKDKKGMNPETNSAYPYQLQVKVFCNEFYCRGIKVSG